MLTIRMWYSRAPEGGWMSNIIQVLIYGTLGLRLPREDGICALPTIWFWPLSNCVNYQDEIRNSEFLKSGRLSWSEAGGELEDKGLPASSFWWNSRPSSSSLHKWLAQCSTSNGALLTFMHIWHYIKFRFQQKFWFSVKNEKMKSLKNVNSPAAKVWKMHGCTRSWGPLRSPGRSGRVRFPLLLKFGNCGNLWKWIGLDLRLSWHPAQPPPTLWVNY